MHLSIYVDVCIDKRILYLLWMRKKAWLSSGDASLQLCVQLVVLNLCRVQLNLRTLKAFQSKMCCPVSENNWTSAKYWLKTQLKHKRISKNKTLVNCILLWPRETRSKLYWTLVEWAKTCCLEKAHTNLRQVEYLFQISLIIILQFFESYRNLCIAWLAGLGNKILKIPQILKQYLFSLSL